MLFHSIYVTYFNNIEFILFSSVTEHQLPNSQTLGWLPFKWLPCWSCSSFIERCRCKIQTCDNFVSQTNTQFMFAKLTEKIFFNFNRAGRHFNCCTRRIGFSREMCVQSRRIVYTEREKNLTFMQHCHLRCMLHPLVRSIYGDEQNSNLVHSLCWAQLLLEQNQDSRVACFDALESKAINKLSQNRWRTMNFLCDLLTPYEMVNYKWIGYIFWGYK